MIYSMLFLVTIFWCYVIITSRHSS
jgi:hypothetical protein